MRTQLTAILLLLLSPGCSREQSDFSFLLPESRTYLLIGDSLSERSDGFYMETLSPDQFALFVRGIDGYDYRDWYLRMDQAFAGVEAPDRIISVLGSNDAARFSGQEFLDNVNLFHEALRQRSGAPISYSLPPRTRFSPVQNGILANNQLLMDNLPTGATLIDLDSAVEAHLNSGGVPLYPDDDPIHPNRTGYELMGTVILKSIY
ncbi:MAG: hypothetical protein CMN76_19175 [Spirochaetaceae bacterium]|nr:hypothetical protein [Spirochaetaceae bacterium]|tara:strand:+ start:73808 stop:74422 length:615 start_codon:yes stop_codon:yes gene_type:complete